MAERVRAEPGPRHHPSRVPRLLRVLDHHRQARLGPVPVGAAQGTAGRFSGKIWRTRPAIGAAEQRDVGRGGAAGVRFLQLFPPVKLTAGPGQWFASATGWCPEGLTGCRGVRRPLLGPPRHRSAPHAVQSQDRMLLAALGHWSELHTSPIGGGRCHPWIPGRAFVATIRQTCPWTLSGGDPGSLGRTPRHSVPNPQPADPAPGATPYARPRLSEPPNRRTRHSSRRTANAQHRLHELRKLNPAASDARETEPHNRNGYTHPFVSSLSHLCPPAGLPHCPTVSMA